MPRHVYLRLTIDADTDRPEDFIQAAIGALATYKDKVPEGTDRCSIRRDKDRMAVGTLSIHNIRKD